MTNFDPLHRRLLAALLAACILLPLPAAASGDDPIDEFVSRIAPDIDFARYERGELGVVLVSYPRVFLYTAWRAIVLEPKELARAPAPTGGLNRILGPESAGWTDLRNVDKPYVQWLQAASGLVGAAPLPAAQPMVFDLGRCTADAFGFAQRTLASLAERGDATPERRADWVRAQNRVFSLCFGEPGARPVPVPAAPPAPLPPSEPGYWQALREYQIAAAHFYRGEFDQAAERFERIGKTADHPMRIWGAYLALRARLRQAGAELDRVGEPGGRYDAWRAEQQIEQRAKAILKDPELAPLHEATRTTLRVAQARLTASDRLKALSAELEQLEHDPNAEDHLGDWRRLANDELDDRFSNSVLDAELRFRFPFFDWIRTLQHCGRPTHPQTPQAACAVEATRALQRWRRPASSPRERGEQRAWLLAALAVSVDLPSDLERAGLAVGPDAPEYWSVQYNLVRLNRLTGRHDKAFKLAQAALVRLQANAVASPSAANLFKEAALASAPSLQEASAFLARMPALRQNSDTGEVRPALAAQPRFAQDGALWLNSTLAVADLLAVARDDRLPAPLRARIAVAAWMRADLMGMSQPALDASGLAAQNAPSLLALAQRYQSTADSASRQHVLLVAALRRGLSPDVPIGESWIPTDEKAMSAAGQDVRAGMWCAIAQPPAPVPADARPWSPAEPPQLAADLAQRDREVQALRKLKTATGLVGGHALAWAASHPDDPDTPWLLHVFVRSTRGGCVEADNSEMSKKAYTLLHKRYKGSTWARQTPYWY